MHGIGAMGERTWVAPEVGFDRPAADAQPAGARTPTRDDRPTGPARGVAVVPVARRHVALHPGRPPRSGPRGLRPARTSTTAAWGDIAVPGNWTVQGWDRPHYTNIVMPFPQRPPDVPDDNPTGLYRTTFRVPREWKGRRVVLHIGGAESVVYAYVNGAARRHGQGHPARLASSTSPTCVRPGRGNTAGLHGRALVRRQPHRGPGPVVDGRAPPRGVRLRHRSDATSPTSRPGPGSSPTTPGSSPSGRSRCGRRSASADAGRHRAGVAHERAGRAPRRSRAGRDELRRPTSPTTPGPTCSPGHVARVRARSPGVRPWSAEDPHRYRVLVSLLDPDGRGPRGRHPPHRLPHRRDRRPAAARSTAQPGVPARRQPPRPPPRHGQGGHGRGHAPATSSP